MTEQELVQQALAHLPRPAPPPRLRRAVMAQVTAEAQAEAAASQARTWSRTESDGWTTERWEGAISLGDPVPAFSPTHVTYTHWRQDEADRTTIYQFTQTN